MHVYIKYHISIFFLRMIIFYFLSKETIYFLVKKYHLSRYYKKDHIPVRFFWTDHLFQAFEENIIFPNIIFLDNKTRKTIFQYDFFLERSSFQNIWRKNHIFMYFVWERSFIFRLKNKMIVSGKINIIFPDNPGKIIFQRNYFGKTISSEHLEKRKYVFCEVIKCWLFFAHNFFWWHMYLHLWHSNNSLFEFYKTIVLQLKNLFYIKIKKRL